MLVLERIDYLLDYQPEIGIIIEKLGLDAQLEIHDHVIHGDKYYVGFADSKKGAYLKSVFDREMSRLFEAGELHRMYSEIGDPSY